jgi:hypothetical protein
MAPLAQPLVTNEPHARWSPVEQLLLTTARNWKVLGIQFSVRPLQFQFGLL